MKKSGLSFFLCNVNAIHICTINCSLMMIKLSFVNIKYFAFSLYLRFLNFNDVMRFDLWTIFFFTCYFFKRLELFKLERSKCFRFSLSAQYYTRERSLYKHGKLTLDTVCASKVLILLHLNLCS